MYIEKALGGGTYANISTEVFLFQLSKVKFNWNTLLIEILYTIVVPTFIKPTKQCQKCRQLSKRGLESGIYVGRKTFGLNCIIFYDVYKLIFLSLIHIQSFEFQWQLLNMTGIRVFCVFGPAPKVVSITR